MKTVDKVPTWVMFTAIAVIAIAGVCHGLYGEYRLQMARVQKATSTHVVTTSNLQP